MSDKHKKTVTLLRSTGHAVPINDKTKERRIELGLPEVPPTIFVDPEEIKKLAKLPFQMKEE